ncbi:MAG TPA: class I SAM-dependent methyltransferase, partial [Bryobacteraceae bacterium]|nr:class I SAM-dependent methyltransferase [Bryobacteraceae bacterium]
DQRLFDDPILLDLLPAPMRFALRVRPIRDRFAAVLDRVAPGIRGAMLCRTRSIDDAVNAAIARGLKTVVILGAGLDTRACRLPQLARTTVFELDLPAIQDFKKSRLAKRLGSLPPNLKFIPADFNVEPIEATLARAGLAADQPALFVWEGVTQYLNPSAVDAVLRTVAARARGTELVFTYILEEVITGRFRADRSAAFRKSASRRPEPWQFGIDPSRLETFLRERGLTLQEDSGADDYLARYLNPLRRPLPVSEIERVARALV